MQNKRSIFDQCLKKKLKERNRNMKWFLIPIKMNKKKEYLFLIKVRNINRRDNQNIYL